MLSRAEIDKKHFDRNQPFYPLGFSIHHRNPGHWDVYAAEAPGRASAWLEANPGGATSARDGQTSRAFRIRGAAPKVLVLDERWNPHISHPRDTRKFASVQEAMQWIIGELMQEPPETGDHVAE